MKVENKSNVNLIEALSHSMVTSSHLAYLQKEVSSIFSFDKKQRLICGSKKYG